MIKLYSAIDRQETLREGLEAKYTFSISSQSSASGNLVLDVPGHNFVDYDVLKITGTDFDDYNDSFQVTNINNDDITLGVSYSSSASVDSASINSVRIYNNYLVRLSKKDFPTVMLDIDDTLLQRTAGNLYVTGDTFYPIVIINSIDNFPKGDNVQVMQTRRYLSYKMDEILEFLEDRKIEVVPNVSRKETVWNNHKVSLIAITFQY